MKSSLVDFTCWKFVFHYFHLTLNFSFITETLRHAITASPCPTRMNQDDICMAIQTLFTRMLVRSKWIVIMYYITELIWKIYANPKGLNTCHNYVHNQDASSVDGNFERCRMKLDNIFQYYKYKMNKCYLLFSTISQNHIHCLCLVFVWWCLPFLYLDGYQYSFLFSWEKWTKFYDQYNMHFEFQKMVTLTDRCIKNFIESCNVVGKYWRNWYLLCCCLVIDEL